MKSDTGSVALDINVAKDFSDVERKKAALFYDTPTIALIPDAGTPSPALLLFQELLNTMLGIEADAVQVDGDGDDPRLPRRDSTVSDRDWLHGCHRDGDAAARRHRHPR